MTVEILERIADMERGGIFIICLAFAVHFIKGTDDRPTLRRDNMLRGLIASLMLWLAFGCIYGSLNWFPIYENVYVHRFLIQLDLMSLPIVFLLLTNLTRRKPITVWRMVKYIVPICCICPLCFLDIPYFDIAYLIATAVYVALMSFHMTVAIVRYEHYMRDQYSDSYGRSLRWIIWVLSLLALALVSWLGFMLIGGSAFKVLFYLTHMAIWPMVCLNVGRIIQTRENTRTDTEQLDRAQIGDSAKEIDTSADEDTMMQENRKENAEAEALHAEETDSPSGEGEKSVSNSPEEVFLKRLHSVCEETKLYTTEDLTREELARAMMMNHTYLTKMLKQTTGKSFYEYINGLRMEYAAELLKSPDFPLEAIPLEVGYRHRSTYYRVFSETYGCTPTVYRDKCISQSSGAAGQS